MVPATPGTQGRGLARGGSKEDLLARCPALGRKGVGEGCTKELCVAGVGWGGVCYTVGWGGPDDSRRPGRTCFPLGASVALRGHLVVREGSAFG